MSDKMNEAVKDIAAKHGVVLGKDDPVLILQTMNERLLEENRKAQQEMLAQFREEMENISSQWKNDAKEKAEKVLNAALAGSKEVMDKTLKESAKESALAMRKMLSESLAEAHDLTQQARTFSRTLLLSALMLTGICLAVCFSKIF
ncbi:conjugal transfer protein TraM [Legionella pneumophila]|uniref:conjugal transfer protein TraM n=1 Tax=Legionella pneumophila TaxID=446 RepID=UPI0010213111|nr:conjugal transfer protein TraM [Legionella pneumophila]RYW83738.1 conjugal transfer protein TraM [Legionella pneumophila]HCD9498747.1 conjugal transfer protein TraM [Legionella pneumophila]